MVGLYRSGCCLEDKRIRMKAGAGKPLGRRCYRNPQRRCWQWNEADGFETHFVINAVILFFTRIKNGFSEEVDTLLWLVVFVDLNCV